MQFSKQAAICHESLAAIAEESNDFEKAIKHYFICL